MKNILVLFLFAVFALIGNAQTPDKIGTVTTNYTAVNPGITFGATDTIKAVKHTYIIEINSAQRYWTTQQAWVSLDTLSIGNATIHMLGSRYGNTWAACSDTITYTGAGGAAIKEVYNDTAVPYEKFRLVIKRTTGGHIVKGFGFKQKYVMPLAD